MRTGTVRSTGRRTCRASATLGGVGEVRRISERSDRALELILPQRPRRTEASPRTVERLLSFDRTIVPARHRAYILVTGREGGLKARRAVS